MQNVNPSTVDLKSYQCNEANPPGMIGWCILNEPQFINITHAIMIGRKRADSRVQRLLRCFKQFSREPVKVFLCPLNLKLP